MSQNLVIIGFENLFVKKKKNKYKINEKERKNRLCFRHFDGYSSYMELLVFSPGNIVDARREICGEK